MLRLRFSLLAVALATAYSPAVLAAENWDLCRAPSFVFAIDDEVGADETRIEARSIASDDRETLHLIGDVSLTRRQQKITADDVVINKSTEQISARGNVRFEDPNYRLSSPAINIDNLDDTALIENPEFELPGNHAHGQADEIRKIDQFRSRYSNLAYTTCDPDDRDWHLRAAEMEIDDQSGRGSAKHTRLFFKGVPFLYLPWFQFPVDDRRMSGLLTPSLGYSEDNGNNVVLPVYWNIAPNFDMTITPSWFSDRGTQLNTENRYLFKSNRGQLDLSYLDDEVVDDSRWFQQWRHQTEFSHGIRAGLQLVEVSDGDIFDDFENMAPQYNNARHLERHVSLQRSGETWNSQLMWQDYQTLDSTTATANRPYNRLPRFTLDADPQPWRGNLETPLQLELVEFDREDSVTGTRSHIQASLEWRSSNSWYFFEPELQLSFTDYRLQDNATDNSINRSLPTFGLDSGLIFERLAGSKKQWLQTFEPRLYFLHTPFEDQDDIPDFDTSLNARTYSNLFKNNRFTGVDRIGDANRITLGLASRIFHNDSGNELMQLRVGQAFYLKDRRVSLDGSRDDSSKSDVITELEVWPNSRTKVAARVIYEQAGSEINDRDLSINYVDDGLAANLGYYFKEDELEQALISLVYPINERWTIVAKAQRSLQFEKTVENLLGIHYESCCWGLKILAGQSGDELEDFAETDNSIYFELTLKGLSKAGRDIDAQLREAIPGYDPTF
ncbi:MAG: LPS assembly protein LptD [Gammaproteobacteria bacterium]|nr:LPS assembly protein LptD [Gammaproteobacteria bacterium]